jgi:hypothetical protein
MGQIFAAAEPTDTLDEFKRRPDSKACEKLLETGNPLFREKRKIGLKVVSDTAHIALEHSILFCDNRLIEIQPAHQRFAAMPYHIETSRFVSSKPIPKSRE